MRGNDDGFIDSYLVEDGDRRTIAYRSGTAVYEEGLLDGIYCALNWNGAGYLPHASVLPEPYRLPVKQFTNQSAFKLNIGGQQLNSHFEWAGYETEPQPGGLHVMVRLHHQVAHVNLTVHTFLDGTPVLTRWLEIESLSDAALPIASMSILSGGLHQTRNAPGHTHGKPAYRVGYMAQAQHLHEGLFAWRDLPNGEFSFGGRFTRERYRHPMFVLESCAMGEGFICQLGYSGGYRFSFDVNEDVAGGTTLLGYDVMIESFEPIRVLAPRERLCTPKAHMGVGFGGLDNLVNAMNRHIRKSVMGKYAGNVIAQPVEGGLGPEMRMRLSDVKNQIDFTAARGGEVFFIDASWYCKPDGENDWIFYVGDWFPQESRYEGGIAAIREYCHQKGMRFGLWMEPERLGRDSQAFKDHADWCTLGYDGAIQGACGGDGGMLDLSKPQVAEWFEAQIAGVIETYGLEMFRLDHNVCNAASKAYNETMGYLENAEYRYYENWYAVFDRLRRRFPDVIFEMCASGGGRTDLAALEVCAHTWVTDHQIAPRSFGIINGMSMCMPPEMIDRLIGGQNAHVAAELDFHIRLLFFGRPSLGYITPPEHVASPVIEERLKAYVQLYKTVIRPMYQRGCDVFHHTPELTGTNPTGTGVLEMADYGRTVAVMGIFNLAAAGETERRYRFRGVDAGKRYRLWYHGSGESAEVSGFELANAGVCVRLDGALTSELLKAQEI